MLPAPPDQQAEAVIITGPLRGKIVTIPMEELTAGMEVEALLDAMLSTVQGMAETTRSMTEETRELLDEIRASRAPQ